MSEDENDAGGSAPADTQSDSTQDAGGEQTSDAGGQQASSTDGAGQADSEGGETDSQSGGTGDEAGPSDDAASQGGDVASPFTDAAVEAIAHVCNDANSAYAASIGDFTYGPWGIAPEAVRESIRSGVRKHLENPTLTAEQSHEAWLEFKRGQGYTYGPVRDDEAKVHPCMLPYADLPQAQRSKDFIFRGVVHSMARVMGLI